MDRKKAIKLFCIFFTHSVGANTSCTVVMPSASSSSSPFAGMSDAPQTGPIWERSAVKSTWLV